jgi:hypothetical protein
MSQDLMVTPAAALACGGAPANIKPGYERLVYIGAAAVEAFVAGKASPIIAELVAPIIAQTTYDLLHICSNGDPGDPGITAADIALALDFTSPVFNQPAVDKLQQWFIHQMFPTWCDCSDGTSPPPAAPSPLPPASKNPGLPSGPTAGPCWDVTNQHVQNPNGTTSFWDEVTTLWLPGPLLNLIIPGGGPHGGATIPTGTTAFTYHCVCTTTGDTSQTCQLVMQLLDSALNPTTASIQFGLLNSDRTGTVQIPSNSVYWQITQIASSRATTFKASMELSFNCTGQGPGQVDVPCCPPDPLIDQRLQAILQLEQAIYAALGNQLNSYATSTVHAGLSGSGSIAIGTSCIAARVQLTTIPPWVGKKIGSPTVYFDVGFVTALVAGYPYTPQRIEYANMHMSFPPLTDQIDYTLENGVVATITELTRGP